MARARAVGRAAARYKDGRIARSVRDFISRDWKAARDAKDAYWGDRILRLGLSKVLARWGVGTASASGLEDEFLDRARPVDLGGTTVPLIDPRT